MSVYTAAITLLLVLDPFGNAPVFLALLKDYPEQRRKRIIIRETVIALLVLLFFLLFGKYILTGMQISAPAISISGGVILFLIAINMIFPSQSFKATGPYTGGEPVIVPLAVPLIAGPSAITILILFTTQQPERTVTWLIALMIAWSLTFVVLYFSSFLYMIIGYRIMNAIEKLMGMILTTLAVQMLLNGIAQFLPIVLRR